MGRMREENSMGYDKLLEPKFAPELEVDCPGYIRCEPCRVCGEIELREDPPRCYGCDHKVDIFTSCNGRAYVGSEESCPECGYPAPSWEEEWGEEDEEPDWDDEYDPLDYMDY